MLKELYGKEENANKSAIGIIFIMCVALSLISVRYWKYQNGGMTLIALYPMSVGIVMFFFSITAYFFKKKKNSERFIGLKYGGFICSLILIFIVLLPFTLIKGSINYAGRILDKETLFDNLPIVLVESSVYLILIQVCMELTLKYKNAPLVSGITIIIITIIMLKICKVLRKLFINGKYKYYENFKYAQDLGDLVSYIYICVGIIYNMLSLDDNYIILMWPILLIIGTRDLMEISYKKQRAKKIVLELRKAMEEIELVKDVLETVSENQEFRVRIKLSVQAYEWDTYYLLDCGKMNRKRKKRYKDGVEIIKHILNTTYEYSTNNSNLITELNHALNNISKCLC